MNALLQQTVPFRARRSMAAAAFDRKIYFFGGVGSVTGTESILDVANDLWCFDTTDLSWREIQRAAPWPPARRCAGWTRHEDGLFLWGGSGVRHTQAGVTTYTFLNDLWRFCPSAEQWELLRASDDHLAAPFESAGLAPVPTPRYTPVFQSVKGELFLFGGYTEDRLGKRKLNDVWIGRGRQWRHVPATPHQGYAEGATWPGLRYGSMSASDGRYVYVCGGASDAGDHNDLWRFDMTAHKWAQLSPQANGEDRPQPRYCAVLAVYDGQLFLFGGRSRRQPKLNFNDLWTFDLTSGKWRRVYENREPHRYDEYAECPGYHAKAAVATVGHEWYVWGGEGLRGHVSDFWKYSFPHRRWQLIAAARSDDPCLW